MVSLINCNIPTFNDRTVNKKIACFGAGMVFETFFNRFRNEDYKFINNIEFIIDNNKRLYGSLKRVNEKSIPVISLRGFLDSKTQDNYIILITNTDCLEEILNQLDDEPELNGMECYISFLLENYFEQPEKIKFTKCRHFKIPKKIHYCWFGGSPIPEHLQNFMKSWNKFCPDYEIIRWDESNYDIEKNLYMKQAYEAKKWGFVPDYARLDIIYNHGGIYLDTDVEILKSYDDLLYDDMFCGFEANCYVNLGIGFGAVKEHPLIKAMAEQYDELRFINADGSQNLLPSPIYQSMILNKYGFKLNNMHQIINNVIVYPTEVLCPKSLYGIKDIYTESTHSIHHFDASWVDKEILKKQAEKGHKLKKLIETRCG